MLRYLNAGESHGRGLIAVLEGVPAGLPLTAEQVNQDLTRRQGGYGRGGRMRIHLWRPKWKNIGESSWITDSKQGLGKLERHHGRGTRSGAHKTSCHSTEAWSCGFGWSHQIWSP